VPHSWLCLRNPDPTSPDPIPRSNKTTGYSKYGVKQFRYNYYDNIVVQNVGDKKIVTVFSNAPASSPHVKGYKIPWK
jgi:hypothetical protein